MDNLTDHPLTLTVEQAAKLLGIGRSTAYELVHTGDIPSLRLGRRIVVPVGQIADRLGMEPHAVREAMVAATSRVARISPAKSGTSASPRPPSSSDATTPSLF